MSGKKTISFVLLSATTMLIGIGSGTASALFLHGLEFVTDLREEHLWIIGLLPLAGLLIGWSYHRYGKEVVGGNDLIIEEYKQPRRQIPFRIAPMVLLGTWITHLFGGSAGREGTAIQMGAAIADRLSTHKLSKHIDRRLLLMMGISGGFASVFGTPWAASIFAFEVLRLDSFRWGRLGAIVGTAFVAHYTCLILMATHTHYNVDAAPLLSPTTIGWAVLAGIVFGLGARLFSGFNVFFADVFRRFISYPPLRPVLGGGAIAAIVYFSQSTKFIGLGVPVIVSSFYEYAAYQDFLIKVVLTTLTLGAGFKGGEVTPLFFVGATLGSALAMLIPLPLALMAGMGFVAVFAGATNTPLACTVMGLELFGMEGGWFFFIGCIVAYMLSGQKGIYRAQPAMPLKLSSLISRQTSFRS